MTHCAPSSPTQFARELQAKASEIFHDIRNHATSLPIPRILSAPSSPAKWGYDPQDLSLPEKCEEFDVSREDEQTLTRAFMRHAQQWGFFLDESHFGCHRSTEAANVAFTNAVYLCGSRFSIWQLRDRGQLFASRVERAAEEATQRLCATSRVTTVLRTIQAEVLLANYYFSVGELEDGKRHWKECVRLVKACELHTLNESGSSRNSTVAGQRIRAFWTVVAMDNTWAGVTNTRTSIFRDPETQVTTPWPLPLQAYADGIVVDPQHEKSSYTMEQFVGGIVNDAGELFSPLGVKVKASALYAEACGALFSCAEDAYEARVHELDNLIAAFYKKIASSHVLHSSPDELRELLVSRTVLCAAFVQLHSPLVAWSRTSQERFEQATREAAATLDIIDLKEYRHIDPVMAQVWLSICKGLAGEIKKARKNGGFPDPIQVLAPCNKITGSMETLVPNSPVMRMCLDQFAEAMK